MFDDNDEYIDYDRLVDESEDLLDDEYYNEDDYNPISDNYREFDYYYHNLTDELTDE